MTNPIATPVGLYKAGPAGVGGMRINQTENMW